VNLAGEGGGGGVTVRLNLIGTVVAPSGLAVAWTRKIPEGVREVVNIVRRLELVGVSEVGENEQDAPAGREAATHDIVSGWAVPLVNFALIVVVPELPC
jgi:hypothetical protein